MSALLVFLLALIDDPSKPVLKESIVVSGIRAEEKTPVTKTDVDKETIEKDYYGQDIPLLLRDVPSINTYTEAGIGGLGGSHITPRRIHPPRINFHPRRAPLAQFGGMGAYFFHFPHLP